MAAAGAPSYDKRGSAGRLRAHAQKDGADVAQTVVTPTREDAWEMALRQFNRAADHLPLKRGIRDFLAYPHRELTVNFPVKMRTEPPSILTGKFTVSSRCG